MSVVMPTSGRTRTGRSLCAAYRWPMPVWSPELVVDEPLVRRLVTQFPELELRSLRRLAEGWDNSVWLVDGRYAFRFPHREVAIPGFRRELEVLPKLPALPLPVPRPAFVGRPSQEFPWPFFGSELLPGLEAGDAQLDEAARVEVGFGLARFLRALHAVELDLALPFDANGRNRHAPPGEPGAGTAGRGREARRLGRAATGRGAPRGSAAALAARASGARARRPPLP